MDEHDLDLFVEYIACKRYVNDDFKKHLQMYVEFYREQINKRAGEARPAPKSAPENAAESAKTSANTVSTPAGGTGQRTCLRTLCETPNF